MAPFRSSKLLISTSASEVEERVKVHFGPRLSTLKKLGGKRFELRFKEPVCIQTMDELLQFVLKTKHVDILPHGDDGDLAERISELCDQMKHEVYDADFTPSSAFIKKIEEVHRQVQLLHNVYTEARFDVNTLMKALQTAENSKEKMQENVPPFDSVKYCFFGVRGGHQVMSTGLAASCRRGIKSFDEVVACIRSSFDMDGVRHKLIKEKAMKQQRDPTDKFVYFECDGELVNLFLKKMDVDVLDATDITIKNKADDFKYYAYKSSKTLAGEKPGLPECVESLATKYQL